MHEIAALEIAEFTKRLRDMSFAIVIRFSFEEVHAMQRRERFLEFSTCFNDAALPANHPEIGEP